MGKKATRQKDAVKFQIPVPAYMVKEIEELATRMNISQATMVELLVEAALEDRDTLHGLFGKWMMAAAFSKAGRSKSGSDEIVRLQVYLSPELNEQVEALATDLRVPKIHLAASLLDGALDEHALIIRVVTTPIAKYFYKNLCSSSRKERAKRIEKAGLVPHGIEKE